MRPPRPELAPMIRLLVFFLGATLALHHSLAGAVQTTPLLSLADPVAQTSCPTHEPPAAQNLTIIGSQPHAQSEVLREAALPHGTPSDSAPFASLPLQAPSKSAAHCDTIVVQQESRGPKPTIRARFDAAKLSALGIISDTKALRARVPAGRGDLSAIAASALRLGSSSLHVAAAGMGLLLLGTIMCML